MAFDND